MRIKKGLFSTSIEFEPREFKSMRDNMDAWQYSGFIFWLKKEFGLNIIEIIKIVKP